MSTLVCICLRAVTLETPVTVTCNGAQPAVHGGLADVRPGARRAFGN